MKLKKIYTENDDVKRQHINDFADKEFALLIFYDENPYESLEEEIRSEQIRIKEMKDNVYKLFPPYTHDTLIKWLKYGNWLVIHPDKVDFPGVDTFRTNEEEVKTLMIDQGIDILIDSFHDNIEWNIFY